MKGFVRSVSRCARWVVRSALAVVTASGGRAPVAPPTDAEWRLRHDAERRTD